MNTQQREELLKSIEFHELQLSGVRGNIKFEREELDRLQGVERDLLQRLSDLQEGL